MAEQGEVKVVEIVKEWSVSQPDEFNFEALGETVTRKRATTLQMVLHALDKDGNVVKINAMPDTGSTHNIMELDTLKTLGLSGTPCQYTVTGHGGHVSTHEAVCSTINLCSPDGRTQFSNKFFAYKNPCGEMKPEDWGRLKKGLGHLRKLDIPSPVQGRPIEAILGCVNLALFEALRPPAIKGPGEPLAKWTPLGWMVGGRTRPEADPVEEGKTHTHAGTILVLDGEEVGRGAERVGVTKVTEVSCVAGVVDEKKCEEQCKQEFWELKENMKRIWDLETEEEIRKLANTYYPGVRSQKQVEAEEQLLRKLIQLPSGQYQTGLMWSGDQRPISNKDKARKAFLNWEKKLEGDPKLREAFHFAINSWIEKCFIQRTT